MTTTLLIDGDYIPVACPIATVAATVRVSSDGLVADIVFVQRTSDEESGVVSIARARRDLPQQTLQFVSCSPDLVRHIASTDGYATVRLNRKDRTSAWLSDDEAVVPKQASPAPAPVAQMASMSLKSVMDALRA